MSARPRTVRRRKVSVSGFSKIEASGGNLVDEVAESSEPVAITGRRGNAVLVSEEDWRAIDETLHLLSIPGMRESIRAGMKEPLSKSVKKLSW